MGFWWVKKFGWQRIFLTDLTDGFLVGEKVWLAADFFNGFNGWVLGGKKSQPTSIALQKPNYSLLIVNY